MGNKLFRFTSKRIAVVTQDKTSVLWNKTYSAEEEPVKRKKIERKLERKEKPRGALERPSLECRFFTYWGKSITMSSDVSMSIGEYRERGLNQFQNVGSKIFHDSN